MLRPHEQPAGNDSELPDSEPDAELPADNVTEDYEMNKKTIVLVGEIIEPKAPA